MCLQKASRLLHLVWRVSLPTGGHTAGEHGSNQQVSVPSRRSRFTLGSDFRLMLPRPLLLGQMHCAQPSAAIGV